MHVAATCSKQHETAAATLLQLESGPSVSLWDVSWCGSLLRAVCVPSLRAVCVPRRVAVRYRPNDTQDCRGSACGETTVVLGLFFLCESLFGALLQHQHLA